MRITSITISGFRSFGTDPQRIELAGDLTTIVGPNASGKTALLQAFAKLFGVTRAQRTIYKPDFHLPPGVAPDDKSTREMFIDVVISLPELKEGSATAETVAPSFRHMQITKAGEIPVCRLRLEARWEDDGTAEGEITQELFWIDGLDDPVKDDDKHPVSPADRGLIQFYYTPAARDAAVQIRASTGALAARLLRAIEWSDETRKAVDAATKKLGDALSAEAAIAAMSTALSKRWEELHDHYTDTDPSLRLVSKRFEEVIAHVEVMFQQTPGDIERGLDVLSDGQQSLFYFALAAAVFDLERDAVANSIKGFRADELRIPAHSVFGIEEPENHLSPYFLSRIVAQVRSIVSGPTAQALITSHSPAVLSRVEPVEVRYCRCAGAQRTSSVKAIDLPAAASDAAKFVRGAVLAFPELYFARFVVLVEGDSERIILPRLAAAEGLVVDPSFVAIVPIGGRHVQHFWRLLKALCIPYATLLDLDLGRSGGGFGRLETAIQYLLEMGVPRAAISGDSCAVWDFSTPAVEATKLAAFVAGQMTQYKLGPRDFAILVRQKPGDYMKELSPAFSAAGLTLRNEAALVGPIAIQDLLAEELSCLAITMLRLLTTQRAGRHWTSCLDMMCILRGLAVDDDGGRARIVRELTAFADDFKKRYPTPVTEKEGTRKLLNELVDFAGKKSILAAWPAYRRADWFDKVLTSASYHLEASSQGAPDWQHALDAYEGIHAVPLMTIHKSKGLEYHTVIFVGLDDGAWWSFANDSIEATAGFFVAFTRAKQRVLFTYCPGRGSRVNIASLYDLLTKAGVKTVKVG